MPFNQFVKILLLYCGSVFFILILPSVAKAEWTEWLINTEVSYNFQDNINRTVFDNAEQSDQVWKAEVSVGRAYQIADYTRLFVTAQLDGDLHLDFDRLNQFNSGINLAVQHKFGIGLFQPWLRASMSARQIFSKSSIREGQQYTAGIDFGKRLHQRFDISFSYLYDNRKSSDSRPVPAPHLIATGLSPGISSDVFDLEGHSVGVQFNTLLSQQWLLILSYNFRIGDVVSSNSPMLVSQITRIVDAIAQDSVFSGWAYRSDGETHRYSIDANYAFLKGHATFNIGYEYIESQVSPFSYQNNLFRMNLNYSF